MTQLLQAFYKELTRLEAGRLAEAFLAEKSMCSWAELAGLVREKAMVLQTRGLFLDIFLVDFYERNDGSMAWWHR